VKNQEVEEREIEYMPPKPTRAYFILSPMRKGQAQRRSCTDYSTALPEYPSDDEFGPDKTFPQFAPENFNRGWASIYHDPVDDNGVSLSDRREAAQTAAVNKYTDELLKKSLDESFASIERAVLQEIAFLPSPTKADVEGHRPLQKKPQAPMRKPTTKLSAPPTLAAKTAASVLHAPPAMSSFPSYAASTKANAPTSGVLGRKVRQPAPLAPPAATRHGKASAASHSTLGYAKGRAVSQGLKKPLSSVFRDGPSPQNGTSAALPACKDPVVELEELVRLREEAADDDDDDMFGGGGVSLDLDDELDDFQLKMPSLE
jgi:hypothetical protein